MVKPRKNPALSDYFVELTKITQQQAGFVHVSLVNSMINPRVTRSFADQPACHSFIRCSTSEAAYVCHADAAVCAVARWWSGAKRTSDELTRRRLYGNHPCGGFIGRPLRRVDEQGKSFEDALREFVAFAVGVVHSEPRLTHGA